MRWEPFGESALILRDFGEMPAHTVASELRRAQIDGVQDVVASYETVGVYFSNGPSDPERILRVAQSVSSGVAPNPKKHLIPVCYQKGEDLEESAKALGMSEEQLIAIHCGQSYKCYAVGFCPGFAYLGYLDEHIARLPRLPSPRVKVEPGSVGITGRQTAVYPLPTPGGWHIIGRTPLTLVDLKDAYFPIQAGDVVLFVRIDAKEFQRRHGERL